ncbi:MAG: hypothetical protein QG599_1445 [Pseudomonadota bacterium]|nr:hypothetical protein [Pseudomonadota bacterium]
MLLDSEDRSIPILLVQKGQDIEEIIEIAMVNPQTPTIEVESRVRNHITRFEWNAATVPLQIYRYPDRIEAVADVPGRLLQTEEG